MAETCLDDFLAAYDPAIRELALHARALVLDVLPDTIEQVDAPARIVGYGYDRTYTGMVCAIAPQKSYVNLLFSHGATLDDPDSLLEGTGKRARHVKLRHESDVARPALRRLLEANAAATRDVLRKRSGG